MKKQITLLAFAIIVIIATSCSETGTTPTKPAKDIDELVRNAGELLPQPQSYNKMEINSKSEAATESNENFISNSKQFRLSNKFDEIVALNNQFSDILFPGAIVQGKDVLDGKLTPLGNEFPREPITITLQNGESKKINNPSLSNVTNGINEILKNAKPTPAQMNYEKTELFNTDQAFLELGLDANWLAGSFSGKFQKENGVKKKSLFLYFRQIYYTIAVEGFSNPSSYFASSVNLDQLKMKIYSGNPPCYISSVNYGRIIIVKMTSEESYENMKSSLQGKFAIVGGKSVFDKSKFSGNYKFDAVVLGGSASGATQAITSGTIEDIDKLIRDEANYSQDKPGFPISYNIRYLDGSNVKLGKTTEYWMQDWKIDDSQYQKFDLYFSHFDIIYDGNEWGDGKFYYKITVTDKNGNVFKDANGLNAIIETDRFAYAQVGSGGKVNLNKQIYGIAVKKNSDEKFQINVELMDYFGSGNDEKAGSGGYYYTYPWNTLKNDWITLNLNANGYNTDIVYKIIKK